MSRFWRATRWARAGLLAALCVATGCSRSAPADTPESATGQVEADSLEGAPDDWGAFLTWAENKLQSQPPPVPLPASPELGQPRGPLYRLSDPDHFNRSRRKSDWTAPARLGSALAEIGPFRSDQRTGTFSSAPTARATPEGKDALSLSMRGFAVQCEDVGSIELTIRVPFGEHIVLKWGKAGSILIPVESHDNPFSVRILTDEFAEWAGPLNQISIVTDGYTAGGVVTIQSLRFMPREASYPEAAGLKRVRLGHEIRTAIYSHCPAEITFDNIAVPPDAKLSAGIGSVSGTGANFEVIVGEGEQRQTVLSQNIEPAETWSDVSASLATWSGKEISITLRATSPSQEAIAFWGNPTLYGPVADPPVVVLYLIDTVAAEHLNLHGYERATMPRLATMAGHGVMFTQMFSNSSRTIESIPDMMLSMPVERHGVHHNSTPAPQGLVTIAEALRAGGFATASFCTNVNAGPRQAMDQGFDTFIDKIGYYWTSFDRTIPLEEVMAWIARHRDQPMFLYIHTAEPHAPYTPPEGFAGRFDPDYRGQVDGTYDRATTFRQIRNPRAQQRDLDHVKALYDEEILYSDARFGLFLDAMQQQALLERAHIFVTSDHGEEFLQHGHWEHGLNLHNEQTRVPLVAYGPGFASGARVDAPAQLVDVMPTILDLFDLPVPYPLAGKSLLPLLFDDRKAAQGSDGVAADVLAAELRDRNVYASNHNYRISSRLIEYSVVAGSRWKLVYGARAFPMYPNGPSSRFLLFDLQSDPRERRNLIHQQQALARELLEDLVRWRVSQHVYGEGGQGPTVIDAEQIRQLEALGYIGGSGNEDEPNAPEGVVAPDEP